MEGSKRVDGFLCCALKGFGSGINCFFHFAVLRQHGADRCAGGHAEAEGQKKTRGLHRLFHLREQDVRNRGEYAGKRDFLWSRFVVN